MNTFVRISLEGSGTHSNVIHTLVAHTLSGLTRNRTQISIGTQRNRWILPGILWYINFKISYECTYNFYHSITSSVEFYLHPSRKLVGSKFFFLGLLCVFLHGHRRSSLKRRSFWCVDPSQPNRPWFFFPTPSHGSKTKTAAAIVIIFQSPATTKLRKQSKSHFQTRPSCLPPFLLISNKIINISTFVLSSR